MKKFIKKIIVLSGANITSGGPLTIFNYALNELSQIPNCEIIAIVANQDIFYKSENISFIELPKYKKHIYLKFYYEFIHYKKISKKINPDVWISLNDFTPNVEAKEIFTYFHNVAIFFKITWSDLLFSKRVIFQKLYYSLFLRFNMKKNKRFIVQQSWIANKISAKYNISLDSFLIFRPSPVLEKDFLKTDSDNRDSDNKFIVFYPTKAVGFKNIELICNAVQILVQNNIQNIELRITIDKDENNYSKYLSKKYGNLPIIWLGVISREAIEKNYIESSVLVFPSRLESWGLPLTEFSNYNKPIIAINLEYVYETLYNYPYLAIFEPNDPAELSRLLTNLINDKGINYYDFKKAEKKYSKIQSINNWKSLLEISE